MLGCESAGDRDVMETTGLSAEFERLARVLDPTGTEQRAEERRAAPILDKAQALIKAEVAPLLDFGVDLYRRESTARILQLDHHSANQSAIILIHIKVSFSRIMIWFEDAGGVASYSGTKQFTAEIANLNEEFIRGAFRYALPLIDLNRRR